MECKTGINRAAIQDMQLCGCARAAKSEFRLRGCYR